MSPLLLALLAGAGGVGAGLRYLVDTAVRRRIGGRSEYPWGTLLINLSGSFLLGVITGLATRIGHQPWTTVAGTGLLGGYTTFSTASVESVRLLQQRRIGPALLSGLGMLVGCVLAAFAGLLLGRL